MGPVVPSLYTELKQYGSAPIPEEYLGSKKDREDLFAKLKGIESTLESVYEQYATLTAFELVVSTHNEVPWLAARKGLRPDEPSEKDIEDSDILAAYK